MHIPSPAHDIHGNGRNSRVSWPLVMNKVMTTFTTYRIYFLSNHPLRPKLLDVSSSAATLGGRTRPKSHFVQLSRSARPAKKQRVGKARIKSHLDYILSGCTQNSHIFAKRMAKTRQRPHLLLTSSIHPSGSHSAYGARSQAGAISGYTQSRRTRASLNFLPYARQSRDDARVPS
jgi:hypothetical protein